MRTMGTGGTGAGRGGGFVTYYFVVGGSFPAKQGGGCFMLCASWDVGPGRWWVSVVWRSMSQSVGCRLCPRAVLREVVVEVDL